jgi:hypothetical protein
MDLFRWVDKNGKAHFTDNFSTIPEEYQRSTTKENFEGEPITLKPSMPAPATSLEVFRWKDSGGNYNYSEDFGEIPTRYRNTATKEFLKGHPTGGGFPNTPLPEQSYRPTADSKGRDEAWWKNLRRELEGKDAELPGAIERTKARIMSLNHQTQLSEVKKLQVELENMEKEIVEVRQLLESGLVDEARDAGADPDWVRPAKK